MNNMIQNARERKYLITHTRQLTPGCIVKSLQNNKRYTVKEVGYTCMLDSGKGRPTSIFPIRATSLIKDFVLIKEIILDKPMQPKLIIDIDQLKVHKPRDKREYGIQYSYIVNSEDDVLYRYESEHYNSDTGLPTGSSVCTNVRTGELVIIYNDFIINNFYEVEPEFRNGGNK